MDRGTNRIEEERNLYSVKDFSDWSIYEGFSEGGGRSEKQWLQSPKGEVGLFKWPKIDPQTGNQTYEFLSEHLAYRIGNILGIPTAKVDIGMYDSRIGSISYLVNGKNEELREGAWFILGKHPNYDVDNLYDPDTREYYSIKHIFEVIEKEEIQYYWMKMMFFDFLIGNRDRHQNNWAYLLPIEDKGKNIIRVRTCPLYDNGSSLCCYINEDRLDEYLGKDRNRLNALVDTKSRSAIRIDPSIKKGPKHSDVVKYLFDKYPKSKMIADNMIEKMTESSIKELINAYPVTLVSQKRKQLLGIFLKEKVNLLTRLRNEVYGE